MDYLFNCLWYRYPYNKKNENGDGNGNEKKTERKEPLNIIINTNIFEEEDELIKDISNLKNLDKKEIEKEIYKIKQRINFLKSKQKEELDKLNQEKMNIEKTYQEKEDKLNKEKTNIEKSYQEKVDKLNQEINNLKNSHKEEVDKLNQEINNLENTHKEEVDKLNQEINNLKNTHKEKEDKLNQEINNLKNTQKEEVDKLNKEINNLKNSQKEEVDKLNQEIYNLKNIHKEEVNKLNQKINDLQLFQKKQIDELSQEKINLEKAHKEEVDKYRHKIEILEKELKMSKGKIIELDNSTILIGLNNIGATCYMNATLQALSNTKDFTQYFLNDYNYNPKDISKNMSNEFYKLLNLLWDKNKRKSSFSPNDFKETLSKENPLFKGIKANDSKDLITFLLEKLHSELNQPDNSPVNGYAENQFDEKYSLNLFYQDYQRNYRSIISNLFYGVIEIKNQCTGCNYTKFNFQVFNFLEFPLEQVNIFCFQNGKRMALVNSDGTNPDINLYECFDYYQKVELMSGDNQMYCNVCNASLNAYYTSIIYSAPKYLIINLNRGRNAVYQCRIYFPETLKLFKYVINADGNTEYELYAVISHIGPSSMDGHFVAYCRNRMDDKWYCYNDAFVNECIKAQEYNNGMPYILFYRAK